MPKPRRTVKGGHKGRAPVVKRKPVNPKVVAEARELMESAKHWGGGSGSQLFARKFVELAEKNRVNVGRLAEASIQRVDKVDHKRLIDIMKRLTTRKK